MKESRPNPGLTVSSIGMLIVAARRLIRQIVGDLVEPYGLTPHQFWLVLVLKEAGPMCLTDLASALWMDDPTISRMVKSLNKAGYLKVEPDPNHGRRIVITLSAEGEKLWAKLDTLAKDLRDRTEDDIPAAEKQVFRKCLCQTILALEETQRDIQSAPRQPAHEVIKLARRA